MNISNNFTKELIFYNNCEINNNIYEKIFQYIFEYNLMYDEKLDKYQEKKQFFINIDYINKNINILIDETIANKRYEDLKYIEILDIYKRFNFSFC